MTKDKVKMKQLIWKHIALGEEDYSRIEGEYG
jgi:hypothetical protein